MRIARDRRIRKMTSKDSHTAKDATHCAFYPPPKIGVLYELTRLDTPTFNKALIEGTINPDMKRKDAIALVLKTKKQQRFTKAVEQNIGHETSLWLADPPWQTSYELPYETMPLPPLKTCGSARTVVHQPMLGSRPLLKRQPRVPPSDCGLSTNSCMRPKRCWLLGDLKCSIPRIIWDKGSHVRPGRAALMRHEYLLIGVRGGAMPIWLPQSVVVEPHAKLQNSEKPTSFHAMLARMFPLLDKRVELFARRTPPEGWRGWGNQHPGDNPVRR